MERHPLDVLSLVFGVVFAGLGLLFLAGGLDLSEVPTAAVWPVPLILLGLVLAAVGARRS